MEDFSSLFSAHRKQETPSRYEYKPLQAADSIRLVCLTTTNGKVHGTLKEARLFEKPEYRAVSYVWGAAFDGAGDGSPRPFVLDDGQVIQVTANLADFLDVVVQKQPQTPMTFWIDAICINQADEEEKSVQVGIMRQIYDQAAEILIWLGRHDETSRDDIAKMEWCDETMRRLWSIYKANGTGPTRKAGAVPVRPDLGFRTEDGAVKDREGWKSLGGFFVRRNWWHRVWTVQEYIPEAKKLFMCGDVAFSPDWLESILDLTLLLHDFEPGFEFLEDAGFSVLRQVENFRSSFHDGSRAPLTVYDVLSECRLRDASDPRDKVFAPLGLLPRKQRLDAALRIDYSLPVEIVFTNVVEYLLRTMHGLDWLDAVVPSRKAKCASWVPDWDAGRGLVFHPLPKTDKDGKAVYRPWGDYNAPEEDPDATRIVRHGGRAELHVMGILLDEIICLYGTNYSAVDVMVVQSWIERACRELGGATYPHTGETMLEAVLRAITFDVVPVDSNSFARGQDDLHHLLSLPVGEIARKLMLVDASMDVDALPLRHMRLDMTLRRRFAVTRHGFVGLVPFYSSVGDKVFCLSGGPVLYVARELIKTSRKEYTYVGESYFHGLMDGEWREKDLFGHPSQVVLV
ncbi:Heterokaryon incompatibility protein (HET) domain containing protein [Rhypophila sp. PSN 637]